MKPSKLWATLWLVLVLCASANYVVPLFPLYAQEFRLSSGTLTALFAAYLFSLIPLLAFSGQLIRKFGAYRLVGLSLVLAFLAALLGLLSPTIPLLFMLRVLQGAAVGLFMGGSNPVLMRNTPPEQHSQAVVLTGQMTLLGFGLGPFLCAAVAQVVPAAALHLPYLLLLVLLGSSLLVWFTLQRDEVAASAVQTRALGVPAELTPLFWRVLAPAVFIMYSLNGPVLSLLPTYTRTILHSHNLLVGGLLMFVLLSGGLLLRRLHLLPNPLHRLQLGLGLLALGTGSVILAGLHQSFFWLVLGIVFQAVATSWIYPSAVTLAGTRAPAAERTRVLTTLYIVGYLGLCLPTLLVGQIANHIGIVHALQIALACAVICGLGVVLAAQKVPQAAAANAQT
ncbi:MFS transporter [Deinococcus sp. PESE-13]